MALISYLQLPDNIAKIPGETELLIERLTAMSVVADYIADWTAWDQVLQKVLRRAQHCWGISIGNSMICSDIWHKYHEWYFEIVIRNFTSR